ncbi:MAG: hypothetical protein CMB80_00935 [Flammeovirgaceae bacterium]|nr:hypothetical protein [Flammeovirgaceae bacterium]|tara:strand:- start:237 stop:668 length:432 start_codon:yes stop_codon:yes gene_type:complete
MATTQTTTIHTTPLPTFAAEIADGVAVALSKFKPQKDQRNNLKPGEHKVDATVKVTGTVKVGEDFEQAEAQAAQPWALLAVALGKLNNVTVESIVREAQEIKDGDQKEIQEKATKAIRSIVDDTVRTVKGKVTAKLTFQQLVP